MSQNEFVKAIPIIEQLNNEGYEAFFVGGSVRDYLLNRPTGDIDIATSAPPEKVMQIFPRTIPIGLEHGTVVVQTKDDQFEITTFRTDGDYEDFRHPDSVEFVTSIEEDLKRRDFTINAIAMTKDLKILDPFNGQKDLVDKKIVAVGDPEERFYEDPLRMMRAVRFVSQLSFDLEQNTFFAIKKHASLIEKIAIERVSVEFDKMLTGVSPNHALDVLAETGMTEYLPFLRGRQEEIKEFSNLSLSKLTNLYEYRSLLVIHLNIKDVKGFFQQWKRSNELQKQVNQVVNGMEQTVDIDKWFLYENGLQFAKSIVEIRNLLNSSQEPISIKEVEDLYHALPIKSRNELSVSGHDLLKWNTEKAPGPWVSEQLTQIEKAVVYGTVLNENDRIKEWLVCNPS